MPAGGGTKRLGDFLQDPQGHQSPDTLAANFPGNLTRHGCFYIYFSYILDM